MDSTQSYNQLIITVTISKKTNTYRTNISGKFLSFFVVVVVSMVIVINSVIGGSS